MDVHFLVPDGVCNIVFLGEAGCGKSEAAVNLAEKLAEGSRNVDFFDLDMTKPLYRSRDLEEVLLASGINVFFQEQFMDAPTAVGGVTRSLLDRTTFSVLDVGGDYIGARLIGGYAPYIRRDGTIVYYIINPFRPWSGNLNNINGVLGEVLKSAGIPFEKIKLLANPYLGEKTGADDILQGWKILEEMIHETNPFAGILIPDEYAGEMSGKFPVGIFPIKRHFRYEWEREKNI